METKIRMVFCTFPDREKARQIGTVLVEAQLAACVNLFPGVESIYSWEGETRNDSEVLAVIKTTAAAFEALRERIADLHPYDVPEIVGVPVSEGSAPYLDWVRNSVEAG